MNLKNGFGALICIVMSLSTFKIFSNWGGWMYCYLLHRNCSLPQTLILRLCVTLFSIFWIRKKFVPLFKIHPLKSPRLDGFHAFFYQHNWQIVGEDISKFIQTLFLTDWILEDLTQIKLVLMPNVPNPETVSQLRPISLCNTLYKLLTKLLVNRLKTFLPAMIHPGPIWICPR